VVPGHGRCVNRGLAVVVRKVKVCADAHKSGHTLRVPSGSGDVRGCLSAVVTYVEVGTGGVEGLDARNVTLLSGAVQGGEAGPRRFFVCP
jgi:hypothetical protein